MPVARIEHSSLLLSLPSTECECKLVTPVTLPITLCHLHTFLLIIANSRQSTLMAPIVESDGHVT